MAKKEKKEKKEKIDKTNKSKKKIIIIILIILLLIGLVVTLFLESKYFSSKKETPKEEVPAVKEEEKIEEEEVTEEEPKEEEVVEEPKEEEKVETAMQQPTTTTKPATNNSSTSNNVSSSQSFKDAVNKVSLNPMKTRYEPLDNQIDAIVNSIINPSMSNYDKLVAIYNYVIKNMYYSTSHNTINMDDMFDKLGYLNYKGNATRIVYYALQALEYKNGVCDDYASLLLVLTRRVGFETYSNHAINSSGGGHLLNLINAGGTYYILDAQGDDGGSSSNNYFFGRPLADAKNYYKALYAKDGFYDFQAYKEVYAVMSAKGVTVRSTEFLLQNDDSNIGRLDAQVGESITFTLDKDGGEGPCKTDLIVKKADATFDNDVGWLEEEFKKKDITYTFNEPGIYSFLYHVTDTETGDMGVVEFLINVV